MNFGSWYKDEIDKVLTKIERYKLLRDCLRKCSIQSNENIYYSYKYSWTMKPTWFRLFFKIKVRDREEFLNRTAYYKIDDVWIYRDDRDLKKYDVELSTVDTERFVLFEDLYRSSFRYELDKLQNRLSYCVGGDISTDEIYLLCDLDKELAKLEQSLSSGVIYIH